MTTYDWTGRTRGGAVVSGVRAADSTTALAAALRREQILVTKMQPAAAKKSRVRFRHAPARNVSVFTRQLSVMIDAGLPLVQCLELLAKEEPHHGFAKSIDMVRADIESGASMADALERRPEAFDTLYAQMVAAGEAGGILDVILKRLATYIEKQVKLRAQVRSAMMYPTAVLSIAAIVVAILLWKVIPVFADLFKGMGVQLPLPTRIVMRASDLLVHYMPLVLGGLVTAAYAFRRYYATESGRLRVDAVLLRIPIIGKILRKIAVARFCRTLGTLLSSGVPILDGLDITAATAGNAVVERAIRHVRSRIERGETVAAPLRATRVFPAMVAQMIGAGESTGALDTMLGKIAEFYEDEVDVALAGLLTVLEPLLVAVLGGIVGFIVIAMYMPMFSLIDQLTKH